MKQASSSNAPTTIELLSKHLKVSPTEGILWEQLGKLQLDSAEYALRQHVSLEPDLEYVQPILG
jgi:hypothetical protein